MSPTSGRAVRLGVDLGTTWTAAAFTRSGSGTAEVLVLGDTGAAMPSVVALEAEGLVAGDTAERRLLTEPTTGVREPKRRLGDTTPFIIGGTPYGAEALMGQLLRHVLEVATSTVGAAPAQVVITHPANWGEYKLDLLREAARLADVTDVLLVTEPEAAATHYVRLGRVAPGQTVAVYDFGGGTFDVAVVRCSEAGTEVLGDPQGLERLGGLDLDEAVLAHVNRSLDGQLADLDPDDPAVRRGMAQLRIECTKAKEALSADSETTVPVGLPGVVTDIRVTRDEFEAAVRARIADTLGALDRAMASAGVTYPDLAGVLLVGGSSRIPLVAEQVAAHAGRPILVDADAKLVVALGAAAGARSTADETLAPIPLHDLDTTKEAPVADDSKPTTSAPTAKDPAKDPAKDAAKKPAAAGGKSAGTKDPKRDKGLTPGRVAAAVAGVGAAAGVAAAGVAAAGVAAAGALTNDDESAVDEATPAVDAAAEAPPAEETMDAFDDLTPPGSGGGGGGSGGGGGFAGAGGGRRSATVDDDGPSPRSRQAAEAPASAPDRGGVPTMDSPEIERTRSQLRERLEDWEPPAGADPEEAAELRAELEGLVDRFQARPGQSVDDAVATLRDQFEDKVEDFAQDVRIDALVEEERREEAEAEAMASDVAGLKATLAERLDRWQPPSGTDPDAAAELRAELAAIVENYVAVPGSTEDQAVAELQRRFESRVTDFTQEQKIDALVGLETDRGDPVEMPESPRRPQDRLTDAVEDPRLDELVDAGVAVRTADGGIADPDDGGEIGVMTAPVRGQDNRLTDVFDEVVMADPDDGGEVFADATDVMADPDDGGEVVDATDVMSDPDDGGEVVDGTDVMSDPDDGGEVVDGTDVMADPDDGGEIVDDDVLGVRAVTIDQGAYVKPVPQPSVSDAAVASVEQEIDMTLSEDVLAAPTLEGDEPLVASLVDDDAMASTAIDDDQSDLELAADASPMSDPADDDLLMG